VGFCSRHEASTNISAPAWICHYIH
jgi:hypothetical protein